ncbi:hypothetical protein [Brachyspira hyodysenteriae]|uniref:hypothetical protein n=1 Tax=Brachyspira hyodysenteriae TaxID=159 RepID=UPI000A9E3BEB|nr:hypothetical protein [Brachyspira hyodysenteriae]
MHEDKTEKNLREFGNHIEMLKQKYNIEQEDFSKIISCNNRRNNKNSRKRFRIYNRR